MRLMTRRLPKNYRDRETEGKKEGRLALNPSFHDLRPRFYVETEEKGGEGHIILIERRTCITVMEHRMNICCHQIERK